MRYAKTATDASAIAPITVEQVELATLEYEWWGNNQRLHYQLDYDSPPTN